MGQTSDQVFHVTPEQNQQTLITLLRIWLPEQSWSRLRKLLQGRHVQVNGNLCLDEGRKLKPKDVVKVLAHSQARPPREEDVRIRFLDKHLVIVEKPAGVTTLRHAEERDWPSRRKQLQPTLDELLPRVLAEYDSTSVVSGKRSHRIRAVHRLDRETSGLMVFARTPEAEQALVKLFRDHTMNRAYWAIALGRVTAQTIQSDLVRDRGDGRRGSTTLKDIGKHAVTHVRPLEELNGYTVIECRLETGRTHQIRIHLSEAGHILCGEKVYHTPLFAPRIEDPSHAPRIALHAYELGFTHPISGEELLFRMPIPSDVRDLLKRLRGPGEHPPAAWETLMSGGIAQEAPVIRIPKDTGRPVQRIGGPKGRNSPPQGAISPGKGRSGNRTAQVKVESKKKVVKGSLPRKAGKKSGRPKRRG